jgi:simple sugar transport system permease protein
MRTFFREKLLQSEFFKTLVGTLITIIIGIFISFIVMLIINSSNAGAGLSILLTEGSGDFTKVIRIATPIIFTGLSVAFAFRTGLFNIGATGQFTMGALAAIYVGINWTLPYPIHWLVAILVGAFAGFIWGLIPGLLKSYRNVHEVVATIMLNYIAVFLAMFFIKTDAMFNSLRGETLVIQSSARSGAVAGIDISFFVAIIVAVIVFIYLFKTKGGYELRAVGFSRSAAKYAGINEKLNMSLSMAIAGFLAGLGGALLYVGAIGIQMQPINQLLPQGFDGISVALIGASHPLGAIFSGLFIGYLRVGGEQLQSVDFDTQFVDIIVSSIIYFIAFISLIKMTVFKKRDFSSLKKIFKKKEDGGTK